MDPARVICNAGKKKTKDEKSLLGVGDQDSQPAVATTPAVATWETRHHGSACDHGAVQSRRLVKIISMDRRVRKGLTSSKGTGSPEVPRMCG